MTKKTVGLAMLLTLSCLGLSGFDGCNRTKSVKRYPIGSPIVIHGGSVYADTTDKWSDDDPNHHLRNTDAGKSPDAIWLDNVDKDGLTGSVHTTLLSRNWEIILTFTNKSQTQLHICSHKNGDVCSPTGLLSETKVKFVSDMNDQLIFDANKRSRIKLNLGDCVVASGEADKPCNHIKTIEVKGGTSIDGTYQCTGQKCDIAIFNHGLLKSD